MVIIDDDTIAFEHGRTVYLNHLRGGGCSHLGSGFYALVTRSPSPNLCSGEIARVVNPTNGVFVGSCVLGDFVPYRRP